MKKRGKQRIKLMQIVGIGEATADSDLSTNPALVSIGEIPMAQLLCSFPIYGKGDGVWRPMWNITLNSQGFQTNPQ